MATHKERKKSPGAIHMMQPLRLDDEVSEDVGRVLSTPTPTQAVFDEMNSVTPIFAPPGIKSYIVDDATAISDTDSQSRTSVQSSDSITVLGVNTTTTLIQAKDALKTPGFSKLHERTQSQETYHIVDSTMSSPVPSQPTSTVVSPDPLKSQKVSEPNFEYPSKKLAEKSGRSIPPLSKFDSYLDNDVLGPLADLSEADAGSAKDEPPPTPYTRTLAFNDGDIGCVDLQIPPPTPYTGVFTLPKIQPIAEGGLPEMEDEMSVHTPTKGAAERNRRTTPPYLESLALDRVGRDMLLESIKVYHHRKASNPSIRTLRRASLPGGPDDMDLIRQLHARSPTIQLQSGANSVPSSPATSAPNSCPNSPATVPKASWFSSERLLNSALEKDPPLKRAIGFLRLGEDVWENLDPRERWILAKDIVVSIIFLRKRYPWFQLAGHSGQFETHQSPEWVLKLTSEHERRAFPKLQDDPLSKFTPIYGGIVMRGDQEYCKLQNLLFGFTEPCGMDCKMGFRTYLAKDVASSKKRMDLLAKLQKLSPDDVSDEERINGVTKKRYMQQREIMSSTAKLGFRIEAVKMGPAKPKTFKGGSLVQRSQVAEELNKFMGGSSIIRNKYLRRLRQLRTALCISPFFRRHEVVGSSLLLLHDCYNNVGVWMIDFGKTVCVDMDLDHLSFTNDNLSKHEDGYLLGLDNLIAIIERGG